MVSSFSDLVGPCQNSPCMMCLMLPCLCGDDEEEDNEKVQEVQVIEIEEDEEDQVNVKTKSLSLPPVSPLTLIDEKGNESSYMVASEILPLLKPHQRLGVSFLLNHLTANTGALLADYMGLGKSLQVLAALHSFSYTTENTTSMLVLCPTICIPNWVSEWNKWYLPNTSQVTCPLYQLDAGLETTTSYDRTSDRIETLERWYTKGGIMLMGYEMYRLLLTLERTKTTVTSEQPDVVVSPKNAQKERDLERTKFVLQSPGPDVIVLDEGHRIKDRSSQLTQCLSRVATSRRIVLSGYPIQNCLAEYWSMINFVQNGFLGTYERFQKEIELPLLNAEGVLRDTLTTSLRDKVSSVVLRRSSSLLQDVLPPKYEWTVHCKLSSLQHALYTRYLALRESSGISGRPDILSAYATLLMIINHPDLVHLPPPSQKNVVVSAYQNEWVASSTPGQENVSQNKKKGTPVNRETSTDVDRLRLADVFPEPYERSTAAVSAKCTVLMHIIAEAARVGDKVLVFSQSVGTLHVIGGLLSPVANKKPAISKPRGCIKRKTAPAKRQRIEPCTWLRIDGSTSAKKRITTLNAFNDPTSNVRVLLLSTKAGAEGINLQSANRVVLFDVSWNPCHDAQSMCRSHRFGQKKDVHVYRLVSNGTMEEHILELQKTKQILAEGILDTPSLGTAARQMSTFFRPPPPLESLSSVDPMQKDPIIASLQKLNLVLSVSELTQESSL